MERQSAELNRELYNGTTLRAERKGGLTAALWELARNSYGRSAFSDVWDYLTKLYGKEPHQLTRVEEFWHPQLKDAIAFLVDKTFVQQMEEMSRMRMEGQFSGSMWRRSYRSKDFGYYAASLIRDICGCIYLSTYKQETTELLYCEHDWLRSYELMLALEIRIGNQEVIHLIKDAMLGDNQQILLTGKIIRAVIISGNEELVDILLKLLLAARLQEGLRQVILENADAGSVDTLTRILKLCIEEDMFRYSSTIRAFDTWTGLGYGDEKPAVVKKCAQLAYECMTDEAKRKLYIESDDNLEAYFALWGMGCHEVADTDAMAGKLLNDEKKYRRILGWYYVTHTDSEKYRMQMAQKHLDERDEEVLAWVVSNLTSTQELLSVYYTGKDLKAVKSVQNGYLPGGKEERTRLFAQLKAVAQFIGGKERSFTGNPFPFSSITLHVEKVINCMLSVVGYDMDDTMLDELMEMYPMMSVDQRRAICVSFMEPEKKLKHREYLRSALEDRSIHVKELAVKRLSKCKLLSEDLTALADSLRSKSSSFRKAILSILKEQNADALSDVIVYMLTSEQEYLIQAGIELLLELGDRSPELKENAKTSLELLSQSKLSTQTEILLKQLVRGEQGTSQGAEANYTEENGYGLYNPAVVVEFASQDHMTESERKSTMGTMNGNADPMQKGFFRSLFKKVSQDKNKVIAQNTQESEKTASFTEKEVKQLLPTAQEYAALLERMNQVFVKHADYEYEVEYFNGTREKILFGDSKGHLLIPAEYGKAIPGRSEHLKLSMVPFYEEFKEAMGEYAVDIPKMIGLCYVSARYSGGNHWSGWESQPWFEQIENKGLLQRYHNGSYDKYKQRYWQMMDIIALLPWEFDAHRIFEISMQIYQVMIAAVGEENLGKNYVRQKKNDRAYYMSGVESYPMNHQMIGYWRLLLKRCAVSDNDFRRWFYTEHRLEMLFEQQVRTLRATKEDAGYYWYNRAQGIYYGLTIEDYFRACEEKLILKDVLYERELLGVTAPEDIRALTNPNKFERGRMLFKEYSWAQDFTDSLVHRIVEVEEKRGELPTPLTRVARAIERFEGAEYFCGLLAALGKENFFRGYEYSSDTTKKAVLSRLLKRCYPSKEDTVEKLRMLLKQTDISEKRLAEAVMYAPQWAAFAEQILEWQGLKSAVWFFHAHINETFSAEKETEVALYSPITPQAFNDGAFDKDWFLQAYEKLGEKRFQVLYKSAKYITAGSNQHRRSQLYADATLGKLKVEELETEITDKRNQEKMRCYPLIPLAEKTPGEALRRYEFIQKFLKESKQFGSQRRESERKACNVAMQNLSITMGLMDVNRMTWYLESEKMDSLRHLCEPKELDGVKVWLEIDEEGTGNIAVEKEGKRLKTIPKNVAKNEMVLTLKEIVKELKEQKRRAKECLEKAMVESTEFGVEELTKISSNPVLRPLLVALVWNDGNRNGFLTDDAGRLCLRELCGTEHIIAAEAKLRIAHPYDMMQTGEWSGYMKLLYQQQKVQPFKQIFREYYPITEDERQEKTVSRRYAGYQVQPQKTVALLKGRGWTVDYEEGLQKVFYKENLIVRMYALADWFSPADIEAPTLEVIRFYNRDTYECVPLEQIPPILFSETMRDIDLVVSVAHVGGVDPEASHSTVEMRVAIATELVKLMKLTNVTWVGSHAKIAGSLSNYSVHMGSGVVHAEGKGMLAILPVHSQARGRIFLPFADDDPKTAEIMSKIILLAEDKKIKDPSILSQL